MAPTPRSPFDAGMSAEQQFTIPSVHTFDPDAPIVVDVPRGSSLETELSKRRTGLSTHRTGLSEKRTDLSTLRSHLSNERTHLSYVRTAIALIGFGITLNRFVIYLVENEQLSRASSLADTKWVGLGMVGLGIALLAWSIYRYHRTSRDIERHEYRSDWRAVRAVTVIFLILSTVTTIWLFLG
jgi:putative membrane protein